MTFRGDFYLLSLQSQQYRLSKYDLSAYNPLFAFLKINDGASVHSPDLKMPNFFLFSFLFPQECWWIHGWGWEFCSDQLFTYILFHIEKEFKNLMYGKWTILLIGKEMFCLFLIYYTFSCFLNISYGLSYSKHTLQTSTNTIISCLRYNQTWLMPVKSSHFTYLHADFLPALSPNRPHKMQGMVHKFWSQTCKSPQMLG